MIRSQIRDILKQQRLDSTQDGLSLGSVLYLRR